MIVKSKVLERIQSTRQPQQHNEQHSRKRMSRNASESGKNYEISVQREYEYPRGCARGSVAFSITHFSFQYPLFFQHIGQAGSHSICSVVSGVSGLSQCPPDSSCCCSLKEFLLYRKSFPGRQLPAQPLATCWEGGQGSPSVEQRRREPTLPTRCLTSGCHLWSLGVSLFFCKIKCSY